MGTGESYKRVAIASWTSRHEQIVSFILAGLSPETLDPERSHAVRLAAIPIGGSMWADYYLRWNGDVVIVGDDIDHPDVDTVRSDPDEVTQVLVWGTKRYPELRELLPVRPSDASDCLCRNVPILAEGKVICPECNGLGWKSRPDPSIAFAWANGWRPIPDDKWRLYLERELAWELAENPEHALAGRQFSVMGWRGGYDDVLLRLDGPNEFAWVHLAWNRENQPEWPHCELLVNELAVNRLMAEWEAPPPMEGEDDHPETGTGQLRTRM